MTDCCLSPRPEGMTAHTARCLLASVDHLRSLIERPTTDTGPNGASE